MGQPPFATTRRRPCRRRGGNSRALGSWQGMGGDEKMTLGRGTVILRDLDPTVGHEQHGVRPCLVVSDRDVVSEPALPAGLRGSGVRDHRRRRSPSRAVTRAQRTDAAVIRAD
ncbi:MAG TPA: hypothetical protein DFS52_11700 [Myxococcales bacterium]|nr:hypothetical protein [Myxococcales bacterium]